MRLIFANLAQTYDPTEETFEPSPDTPTLLSLDDDRLALHDSSPPPEPYHTTADEYAHYQHDNSHQHSSATSHTTHSGTRKSLGQPSPSPLRHAYSQEPPSSHHTQHQSQVHSLMSVAELVPGVSRPNLIRAGDRAEKQRAQEGTNKWEDCTADEWEKGGRELANQMSELISRMINLMV